MQHRHCIFSNVSSSFPPSKMLHNKNACKSIHKCKKFCLALIVLALGIAYSLQKKLCSSLFSNICLKVFRGPGPICGEAIKTNNANNTYMTIQLSIPSPFSTSLYLYDLSQFASSTLSDVIDEIRHCLLQKESNFAEMNFQSVNWMSGTVYHHL